MVETVHKNYIKNYATNTSYVHFKDKKYEKKLKVIFGVEKLKLN